MRDTSGYTLLEMLVVLGLISLTASLAWLSGGGLINSSRLSRNTTALVDDITLARTRALARYEQWRVRFPPPLVNADAIQEYYVESCFLTVGTPGLPCGPTWAIERHVMATDGLAMMVQVGGLPATSLTYDRTGFLLEPATTITVCRSALNELGGLVCRPGSTARIVQIKAFSGAVDY